MSIRPAALIPLQGGRFRRLTVKKKNKKKFEQITKCNNDFISVDIERVGISLDILFFQGYTKKKPLSFAQMITQCIAFELGRGKNQI